MPYSTRAPVSRCAPLMPVYMILLLLADVIPLAEAGMTFDVRLLAASAVTNTDLSGLNMTVLNSNTTLLLDSRPKIPGNHTTPSDGSDDPDLSWWAWILIGAGFFILILVLVVTAVFYSDYAKRLAGYDKLPPPEAVQPNAGMKVIEVALVHPCRPPATAMMSIGSIP